MEEKRSNATQGPPHLAASVKSDHTTLSLAGDVSHIPEDGNHSEVLVLSPGTPTQEFITYERRIGTTLHGVRRGVRAWSQNVAEYVLPVPALSPEGIVMALADREPISESYDSHWCALCHASNPTLPDHHDPSCPWRLAVEWKKRR